MKNLIINSRKNREVIDITDEIKSMIEIQAGLVNIFLKHTTAALTTADLDPGTDEDYLKAFEDLIPKLDYTHPHNPSHFPDHFFSATTGVSLNIPVRGGELVLGTWQRIVLLEFNGPKKREIFLTFLKE